ncbi:MAG: DUF11 domain-containing protein [Chitinophagales bacterium]|nr:DUF11 domain-containing protein [Chitinophagales bacterium]
MDLMNVVVTDALASGCDYTYTDNGGVLAVGNSFSYECTVSNVTAGFINVADVTGDPVGGGTPVDDTDDTEVTITSPSILIVKDDADNGDDTQAVNPGGTATFTITVTNNGDVDLMNVVVTDALASACNYTYTDNGGVLAVGNSFSYECTVSNVTAGFTNVADVTGDPVGGGNPVDDTDDTEVTITNPSIVIVKDDADNGDDTQMVNYGSTATFTITVTNNGDVDLMNVVVTDALASACNYTYTDNGGVLAVGNSFSYECTVSNVTAGFTNVADVTGDPVGGGNPVDDTDDTEVTVFTGIPQVSIDKDDADNSDDMQYIANGSTATFTITIVNTGTEPLVNVTITDPLAPDCNTVIPGVFLPGATYYYTCTIDNVTAAFTNTAYVTAVGEFSGTIVDDEDATQVFIYNNTPSIEIVKTALDGTDTQIVAPNGTAIFEITVTNTGNVTLTNVVVQDPLSIQCDASLGTMTPGQSISYYCEAQGITEGFTNIAEVSGTPIGGGNPVTDDDPSNVILGNPQIQIVKSAIDNTDTQTIPTGGTAQFAITVTNTGNIDLENVTITDAYAPDCDNVIPYLAVGQVVSYNCIDTQVMESYINVAVVTGTPVGGTEPVSDDDPTVITVLPPQIPAIEIVKSALDGTDVQQVSYGGTAEFEITVTNTGNVNLVNVQVTDPMSPDCNENIGSLAVGQSYTYTCTIGNVTQSFTNIATVMGIPQGGGSPVSDDDPSDVIVITSSIGDFVWNDLDGDGLQDPGEPGVPGITVTLINENGEIVGTTITNQDGYYIFTNLPPGNYTLIFDIPADYSISIPNAGSDDIDSDADSNGMITNIVLGEGENNYTFDVGLIPNTDVCEGFYVSASASCDKTTGTYEVIVTISGGNVGENGYIVSSPTSPYYNGANVSGSFIDGSFAGGTGYTYTITIADHPLCTYTVTEASISCEPVTAIDLISFTGEVQAEGNMLTWITATETDNDYFELARSIDGTNFEKIAIVDSRGDSNSPQTYNYLDVEPPMGITYYRLSHTDIYGKTNEVDKVVVLSRETNYVGLLDVYPIPTTDILHLSYASNDNNLITIVVYDVAGKEILHKVEEVIQGTNVVNLHVDHLAAGTYYLVVGKGSEVNTIKFVKSN